MLSFLKSDPVKKAQLKYNKKLEQAMQAQRNGDIKSYSFLSEEADALLQELESLKLKSGKNTP